MSFVKRTAKGSARFIAIGLLLTLVSSIVLASQWESVTSFAASFGASAQAESSLINPEPQTPFVLIPQDTRTVCNTGTPDFATVALAVADANAAVPAGGRTYLVCAGLTETAPAGGYSITATGASAANPVVFVKDGAGANPTITAPTTHTVGSLTDAIFKIVGADNITIDGFTMLENPANIVTAAATNTMTEFGVALFYATTTNGAQNITLQNNTITLNRTYQNTWGIYSNSTHSATVITTSASATTTAGGNSGLKIYGNTISNVNQGILVLGPTAAADMNTGLDIGGAGGAQANTITNWGTTGTFSGYVNVSGTLNCILVRNSIGFNVSFNTLTSSVGGNTATTSERAIYVPSFSIAPTGTFTNTINSNNISIQSGFITGTLNGIINETTTGTATSTLNINSNNFNTWGHTVAASGAATFINNTMAHQFVTINSNTFTSITLVTTGSVTFISHSYSIPTTGSLIINANSIVTSFTRTSAGSTTLTTTNSVSGTGSINNYTNNNFSNITVTGASTITGFNNTDGGTGSTKTITGNTFNNWTGGTSAINAMNFTYWNGVSSLSNNTITNITGQSTITGVTMGSTSNAATSIAVASNTINNLSSTGTGGAVTGISCSNTSTLINVNNNTINTLSSTGASAVSGISISGATTTNVLKNKIYDLSGSNASSTVNGIIVSSGTTVSVSNNLIGDLRTTAANAANPLIGLNITGGTTVNAYFNTVYLAGSSTGALFGSSAVSVSTTPTVELRDNIFANASAVMGAGLAAAHRRSTTTLTSYAAASNNNDFFGTTIFTDGTNTDATIGAYKTRVASRDSNSFFENPPFLSTVGSNANFLHINTATPTQLESGGTTVSGITDDFDGNTRNVTTPDVGADEFTGTPLDLTAPSITYTALAGTASLANRNLTATITDPSGVASGATAPRIYFKKSTDGAYVSTQCTGTYTCAINYTLVGGGSVVAGEIIQYFVVAQDTAGNVGANPSGGFTATNVNTVLTPPTTPNSYTILPSISGNKNVGAGGDYATLTAAVAALNAAEVSGPVTLTLTDASYTTPAETFPLVINANNGSSMTNMVTIKPAVGVSPTISGSSTGCIIAFNGADYMTIDGSNTAMGTSRDLTITNTNTGTSSAVVCIQTTAGLDGATNDTVKNTNVVGQANTTTLFGIFSGSQTISTSSVGTGNNTNTIQNNSIRTAQNGIYSQGASTGAKNTGNIITQNLINTASPNNVAKNGIQVGFENNIQITQNNVSGMAQTSSPDVFGITLGISGISTSTFTGNEVTNATVTGNMVGSVRNTGTFSACGICVAPATSGTNLIANNTLTGVSANGTGGDFSVGILIGGGAGSTTRIYYNSVSMNSSVANTGSTDKSFALAIGGSDPTVDVRNNALYNTQNNGTGSDYAVVFGYSTFVNLTSNNNDFFVTGSPSPVSPFFTGGTGSISAPTNQATLGTLQTATGKDAMSISADPLFNNPASNLQPQTGSPLVGAATPVSVTTDILGVVRSGATPTIGAYENAIDTAAPVITYTPLLNTSSAANRLLSATITDGTAVATGGNAPRIYYRKNAGAYFSQACSLSSGTVQNGVWNCTINNADVGGVVATDVISYFVVAQDTLGNLAANPSAGFTGTNVNTVTTPPTAPNMYTIVATISGSFNVGSAETYTSLTNAGGIFQFINNSEVAGNITINITSDLTGELGTNALNEFSPGFTVLIKPSGAPRMISGTNASGLIKLNGADGVRIDGSTAAMFADNIVGGNPALRELTITNSSSTGAAIWIGTNATSGATGNTMQNLNIVGPGAFGGQGILAGSGTTFGSAAENGRPNSNNIVNNNAVKGVQNAVFAAGDAVTRDQNWMITQNDFGSMIAAEKLSFRGILLSGSQTFTISENRISGISSSTSSSATMSGIMLSGAISTGSITRNEIKDIRQNNTTGWGSNGIYLFSTSATANVLVANNFISDVTSQGFAGVTSSDNGYGIMIDSGGGYNIYYNTVRMSTNQAAAGSITAAINIAAAVTTVGGINLRANILANTETIGTRYSIYDASTAGNTIFPAGGINYNDYFSSQHVGFLGVAQTTIGAWMTATTQDAQSLAVDPLFVSATNLHIQPTSPIESMGIAIGGITVDFDGDTRPATPDIGADEIPTPPAGTVQFSSATYSIGEGGGMVTLTVTRTGGSNGAVTANYALAGGTATGGAACGGAVDYVNTGGSVMFANGDAADKTFDVAICDDTLFETPDETFNATLSIGSGLATLGTPNPAAVTINENDMQPSIQFSSSTASIGEGGGTVSLQVTRTGALGNAVSATYSLGGGTATGGALCSTAGVDYVNTGGTVSFAATETTMNIVVPICDDTLYETPDETFVATLSSPTGGATLGQATNTVTINENDTQPTFVFSSATYSVNEGVGTAMFTVTRSGALGGTDTVDAATVAGGTAVGGAACTTGVDYITASPTLTFNPTETTKTLDVTFCNDSLYETPDETVNLALSNPLPNGTLGTPNTAVVTINENDTAPTFQFSSATYSNSDDIAANFGKEDQLGTVGATITVTRTGATANAVSVNYATSNGTATGGAACVANSGVDYVSTNGTLNFLAGETMKTFPVTVCSDLLFEGDETVNLTLSMPTAPAVLGTPNPAVLTIVDNETVPTLTFSAATYSNSDDIARFGVTTDEFAPSVATITVNRSGATENAVSVQFATMGGSATGGASCTTGIDYITTSGTLNFVSGDNSETFNVTVCTDALFEGNETVNLVLSMPSVPATLGTPNSAVLTIVDNDAQPSLQFDSATYSIGEAGPTATITVTRTGAPDNAVSVNYAASNGTATGGATCTAGVDYLDTSGTLNFAFGVLSQTFTVPICDDAVSEGSETVNLALTMPTGAVLGAQNTAVLSITDNDAAPTLQFSAATVSVSEAAGGVTLMVTRSGATGNAVTVDYATGGGTATAGACAPGVDYVAASGTLTFGSGVTSQPISVTVCNDTVYELNQTFDVTLSNATGGASVGMPSSETVTITNDDAAPTVTINDISQAETDSGMTNFQTTVTVTGPSEVSGGYSFQTADDTATAPSDYTAIPATADVIPANVNRTTANLNANIVVVNGDTMFEANETFFLNASGCTDCMFADNQGLATITNDDVQPTVQFSAATYTNNDDLSGGNAQGDQLAPQVATITVTRTGATGDAFTVNYATAAGGSATAGASCTTGVDYITTSGMLSFAAGDTSKTFDVTVCSDLLFEGNETVNLAVTGPTAPVILGTQNTAVLTIVDNETVPTLQFSSATYNGNEGTSATITVTRTGGTANAVSVNYATVAGGSATAGTCGSGGDYVSTSGMLNFASGETMKTFDVTLCTDAVDDIAETVNLMLSAAGGGAVLGMQSTAVLTINNVDGIAPTVSYTAIPNNSFNPTLVVTATDNVGVTGVTIFYSFNGGAFTPAACSFSTGSPTNGTWNCMIVGMPTPASVAYYVTATDGTNTAMNPAAGATAPNLFTFANATIPAGNYTDASLSGSTTLAGNIVVNGNLTLNGIVNTGANTLTLGCNATVAGASASSYIVGTVTKDFCATGTFTYPVGTTPDNMLQEDGVIVGNPPEFTPFTANVTAIAIIPSTLTVSVTDGFLTGSDPGQSASRVWNVTETGNLTADISFTYLDQDIVGSEAGYKVLRRSGTTALYPGGTVIAATNTATAPGVTNFSGWAAGNLAPTAANVSISGRVLTANGSGIRNATVMISGGDLAEPRYVRTATFGNYQFDNLTVGQTYVVQVISKKYIFQIPSIVLNVQDNVSDADFVADDR